MTEYIYIPGSFNIILIRNEGLYYKIYMILNSWKN